MVAVRAVQAGILDVRHHAVPHPLCRHPVPPRSPALPDSVSEYDGYEDFFLKRRGWFFGLFAATFVLDTVDALIKGEAYWNRFGLEYFIQVPLGLVLCAIAIRSTDRRVHLAAVALHIAYQAYWISRFFYTVT